MKLKAVCFLRFMQFVDQLLHVDPYATIIVGRNDTGKTNILRWFFDQHVKEGVILYTSGVLLVTGNRTFGRCANPFG